MDQSDQDASITISDSLRSRVQARVKLTAFESMDAYVEFVLKEVLRQVESPDDEGAKTVNVNASVVEDRLESLGYLNE